MLGYPQEVAVAVFAQAVAQYTLSAIRTAIVMEARLYRGEGETHAHPHPYVHVHLRPHLEVEVLFEGSKILLQVISRINLT